VHIHTQILIYTYAYTQPRGRKATEKVIKVMQEVFDCVFEPFTAMDADQDDYITRNDMKRMLARMCIVDVSVDQVKLCICVCVCVCVCVFVHICVCTCVYEHMCICMCVAKTFLFGGLRVCVCLRCGVCVCVYIHVYICR
jgi:hypothetical protein